MSFVSIYHSSKRAFLLGLTALILLAHLQPGWSAPLAAKYKKKPALAQSKPIILDARGSEVSSTGIGQSKAPAYLKNNIQKLKAIGTTIFDGTNKSSGQDDQEQRQTSQLGPKPPTPPKEPEFNFPEPKVDDAVPSNATTAAANNNKQDKNGQVAVAVNLQMGNQARLKGKILNLKQREITIQHSQKGIQFDRTITIDDITSLVVTSYQSKKIKDEDSGSFWKFTPKKVMLQLKDGSKIQLSQIPPEFKEFDFQHSNFGKARMFTWFGDFQFKNGRWRERKSTMSGHTNLTHPKAVHKITFASND